MKAYTDLNQSKKLAKILPVESADMHWQYIEEDDGQLQWFYFPKDFSINQHDDVPCWSLAALLDVLEHPRCFQGDKPTYWFCGCFGKDKLYHEVEADNPVDACYEMIIKLHEQKIVSTDSFIEDFKGFIKENKKL